MRPHNRIEGEIQTIDGHPHFVTHGWGVTFRYPFCAVGHAPGNQPLSDGASACMVFPGGGGNVLVECVEGVVCGEIDPIEPSKTVKP